MIVHKCQPINLAKLKILCFKCVKKYVLIRKKIALYGCVSCINTLPGFFFDILKKLNPEKTPNSSNFLNENSETCYYYLIEKMLEKLNQKLQQLCVVKS